jgi:hypothetical protein
MKEVRAYPERREHRGAPATVLYEGVRFTLQYYWRTEGMTEDVVRYHGMSRAITRGGMPLTDADHGFLQTDIIPLKIPVLEAP